VYRKKATHAAEDVPIYATGPMSHLFSKTIEQSVIAHFMAYSACIGPYSTKECALHRGFYGVEGNKIAEEVSRENVNRASAAVSGSLYLILSLALLQYSYLY
jgi:hypothetical protein